MILVVSGIVAGILGTAAMDLMNYLFSRAGMISKIDIGVIGRMAAGWTKGRFYYRSPDEIEQIDHDIFYGYLAHYAIGVGFALPYVMVWDLIIGGSPSPAWTIVYGIVTTAGPYFLIYPSMGLGIFGRRSPEGIKSTYSSLANHFFFGIGMAAGILMV